MVYASKALKTKEMEKVKPAWAKRSNFCSGCKIQENNCYTR